MDCSKRLVAMGICVVLLFAFAAEVNAQCSLSALAPCYGAVQGAYPPRPNGGRNGACCRAVMTANPACLCSQMQQGRYPQNMIRNAFAMPRVCGRTNLKGYKCGSKCNYSCRSCTYFRIEVSWLATHWPAANIPWFCFVHVNKWSKISTSHRCFLLRQCIECAAIRTFFWTTSSLVLFYSSVHSACDFHVNPEANYRSHHSSHPRTQSRGFWSIWILGEFHLLTLLSVVCAGYTIEWTAATHVSTSQHRRVLERHKSCLKGFWSRSGW